MPALNLDYQRELSIYVWKRIKQLYPAHLHDYYFDQWGTEKMDLVEIYRQEEFDSPKEIVEVRFVPR